MADLIITDSARKPIASLDDYELDLAYGSDENDFKLTCLPQPAAGSLIMMDGTEYGGMVTVRNTDGSVEGPTWHGMLSRRILQPDAGKDYLTVSGNAATILNTLFKRIGLDSLFTADASTVTIGGWQFDRYTDAYTGVTKMLTANNAKLRLTWLDGHVHAIAKPVDHYGDTIDSDLLVFQASLDSQPVNHLIGLGQGDLHDRRGRPLVRRTPTARSANPRRSQGSRNTQPSTTTAMPKPTNSTRKPKRNSKSSRHRAA